MELTIRKAEATDAGACGRIIFEAFKDIADRHHFPWDFPSEEVGVQFATMFINHPSIFGVVAEYDNQIVGSNFLDERDPIRGVGPITIDPRVQQRGIGRRLMEAVIERGKGAAGIRLLQDSFNTASVSLYASLGFDVKEPVLFITGKPKSKPNPEVEVRPLVVEDLNSCAELCTKVHGFDRANDLRDAVQNFKPYVALQNGRIIAYSSAPTFWALNHGVAENEAALKSLLLGAGAANSEPLAFLLPTRQSSLFRWCLSEGLKVVKPMTLMAMGNYQEPKGSYFPSVLY
jgi:GNAT superfamily N-acetyltransferase